MREVVRTHEQLRSVRWIDWVKASVSMHLTIFVVMRWESSTRSIPPDDGDVVRDTRGSLCEDAIGVADSRI